MRESINYYYNFNVSEVEYWGSIYRFKYYGDSFYFVPLKRLDTELEDIILVSKELKSRGILVHDIIGNKFNEIVTNVNGGNYILLKPIGDIYEEYGLDSIINFNNSLLLNANKSKIYRNSWAKLWSDKLDYFEYQIRELGKDKKVILDSFSYYIGLGENAISYVNSTIAKYKPDDRDRICLSHKRINFPNYKLNYFNPLSFIFDLEVRDIASFIKSAFMAGENAISYLKEVLRLKKFSIYSLQLLYARLIYPTYYFDIYEKVMNDEEDEDALIPIIDKSEAYEIFLQEAYFEISRYAPIERIEWLLKKEL